jgi:hypothetical protein
MVAIPIAYDQPGVSARIAHHGVGEFVDLDSLSVSNRSSFERCSRTVPTRIAPGISKK